MKTIKIFLSVILLSFLVWILVLTAAAITHVTFPDWDIKSINLVDKKAWDCDYYTATQKYENEGWQCINRGNRDWRIGNLKTRMFD